eukprot:2567893-Prymnesium_polylepis.1
MAEAAAKGYEVAARGRPGVPSHLAVCQGAGRYSQGGRSRARRRRRRRRARRRGWRRHKGGGVG